jgi:hypothetical protein
MCVCVCVCLELAGARTRFPSRSLYSRPCAHDELLVWLLCPEQAASDAINSAVPQWTPPILITDFYFGTPLHVVKAAT